MFKGLFSEIASELSHNGLFYRFEYFVRITVVVFCHGAYNVFQHKYVFYFGNFGHKHFALSQIAHFVSVAPVAVNNAVRVQVVESRKVV